MITRGVCPVVGAAALVVAACTNGVESPTGPGPIPQPNSTIVYTALGASDTAGVGSSAPCVPATDCPEGRGYVQVATRDLRSRGFTVTLYNLGFPAMVLSRRIEDLGKQYGRNFIPGNIIERQAPVVFTTTTLATVFAGPNDVDAIVAALGGGAGGADQLAYINTQVQLFRDEFTELIGLVREKSRNARIVALNLPNMAGMPRNANVSAQQRRAYQLLSVGMTTQAINPQASTGVLVLDLMCDPRSYQASTYSADGFHPSDTGYAWIAAEVLAAATSTYKAPASSCPQMTLVN